ncbi:N-acetyltransferase [Nocardia sp. NPDC002869]|uniref:N-acetyltransferase n=1 Tax=Nocardia sp. NPDC002869 TaxID=3161032 RepID=UPI00398CE8EE
MTWISTGITTGHDLSRFDCGKEVLNRWLQQSALNAEQRWTSRTYVWTQGDDPVVLGYYAIAPTSVDKDVDGIAAKFSTGLKTVPAFLLAKFALDREFHGQGIGEQMLVDAVTKIMGAAQASGGRLIVVDAIDEETVSFYEKYDFMLVKNTPNRLIMKLATALDTFGVSVRR